MSIEVEIDAALAEGLDAMVRGLEDADKGSKAILKPVATLDRGQNRTTFASQGAKSGGKWRKLTKPYARWKRDVAPAKLGSSPTAKILTLTGSMRNSLTTQKHDDRIERMKRNVIEVGTKHHLADIHQEGKGNNPKRPPVRKSNKQEDGLAAQLMSALLMSLSKVTPQPIKNELRKGATDFDRKARGSLR